MSATSTTGDVKAAAKTMQYVFVININRLIGETSFRVDDQTELRRATDEETDFIKSHVSKCATDLPHWVYAPFWEQEWPHPGGMLRILDKSDWRYYVVSSERGDILDLLMTFDLAPVELEAGFSVIDLGYDQPCVAHDSSRFFHVLEHARRNDSFFVDVSTCEIEAIREIHSLLQKHDDGLINIRHIARQIGDLKKFPHDSPLRFLGYFAILESLLTHAPKPTDPYDSITRQVKKKLTLLDHRWCPRIDYTPFRAAKAETAKAETVWSKLYSYRSLIAHGGEPKFDGDLSMLRDRETALRIVKETTKAVIRQALVEPQLLVDLRDC